MVGKFINLWRYVLLGAVVLATAAITVHAVLPKASAEDPAAVRAAQSGAASVIAGLIPEQVLRVAAVGDGVTAANSPDIRDGETGDESWAHYLPSDSMRFVGGWAAEGSSTTDVASNTTLLNADVLVIMAGMVDSSRKVPFETSAQNLQTIVRTAAVGRVVVSAVPPRDANPGVPATFNAQLAQLAAAEGWVFVDAMAGVRTADGLYAPGMTTDGVHPTIAGARIIGESIAQSIAACCAAAVDPTSVG